MLIKLGLFDKLKEPVFLKDDNLAEKQLEELKKLAKKCSGELKEQIEQEAKLLEAGIYGENTIKFELQNSHIPMYVLHDLFLEHNGLTAQIDYLIITRKIIFVLECKNLYGNIEINSNGDFIRSFSYGKYNKKEGLYSPITQNKRHLDLMKEIRSGEITGFLAKKNFEKNFDSVYRSIVVLSNPKTVLNARYAKKDIKNQVIRADQLIEYINKANSQFDVMGRNDKELKEAAELWLSKHSIKHSDSIEKYRNAVADIPPSPPEIIKPKKQDECDTQVTKILCPKCGAEMLKRTATKGDNVGKEFYGCSNFPRCRGIVTIGQ